MIPLSQEPLPRRDRSAEYDERNRLAALEDQNRLQYFPPELPPDVGELPPEMAAKLPPASRAPLTEPPPPGRRRPLEEGLPRFLSFQTDTVATLGTSVSRFSALITRALRLEKVFLHVAQGDLTGTHFQLLLRPGDDTTPGQLDQDLSLFTGQDTTGSTASLIAANTVEGGLEIPLGLNLLNTPFRFHTRYISTGGAALHGATVHWCRILTQEEIESSYPSFLPHADWRSRFGGHRLPRRRGVRSPAQAPPPEAIRVTSLGFSRLIPWSLVDPNIRQEIIVNAYNGVPTPGVEVIQ